jgi:hypothetical protein
MIEYYDSIEVLPLYNWDKYTTTRDNNWLIIDFNGRQPKIDNEELTALEGKLQEEYFKAVDDRTFVKKLQKWAKIDNLRTRYNVIAMLCQRLWLGFGDMQMELRQQYIEIINKFGFNMPLINTVEGDAEEIALITNSMQNIKTQIEMLESELKTDEKKQTYSLNKQMVLVSLGLGLAYKINSKETTVSEWIELCHLLEEKNAQQAKNNK